MNLFLYEFPFLKTVSKLSIMSGIFRPSQLLDTTKYQKQLLNQPVLYVLRCLTDCDISSWSFSKAPLAGKYHLQLSLCIRVQPAGVVT